MDVERAISSLRVVRDFSDQPLPDEALSSILDAARRTGSSKNTQRWRFIVIRDRERLRRLADVGDYADHLAGATVAIALLSPVAPPQNPCAYGWDMGRAAQSMVLAAWARGIGSVPATVYKPQLVREILGYPDDFECEHLLSFGYPADPTDLTRPLRPGGRRPIHELVHYETWSSQQDPLPALEELP